MKNDTNADQEKVDGAKQILEKRPYLIALDTLVADLRNGTVVVELRVKDGFVTDLITTEVKRQVFKIEPKTD